MHPPPHDGFIPSNAIHARDPRHQPAEPSHRYHTGKRPTPPTGRTIPSLPHRQELPTINRYNHLTDHSSSKRFPPITGKSIPTPHHSQELSTTAWQTPLTKHHPHKSLSPPTGCLIPTPPHWRYASATTRHIYPAEHQISERFAPSIGKPIPAPPHHRAITVTGRRSHLAWIVPSETYPPSHGEYVSLRPPGKSFLPSTGRKLPIAPAQQDLPSQTGNSLSPPTHQREIHTPNRQLSLASASPARDPCCYMANSTHRALLQQTITAIIRQTYLIKEPQQAILSTSRRKTSTGQGLRKQYSPARSRNRSEQIEQHAERQNLRPHTPFAVYRNEFARISSRYETPCSSRSPLGYRAEQPPMRLRSDACATTGFGPARDRSGIAPRVPEHVCAQ